ncbi:MAG: hypothetical protein U1E05_27540, partial [Patescibacteria group bacterium]|nr:hypothetical protein [Patescibacteria group bacterium]
PRRWDRPLPERPTNDAARDVDAATRGDGKVTSLATILRRDAQTPRALPRPAESLATRYGPLTVLRTLSTREA